MNIFEFINRESKCVNDRVLLEPSKFKEFSASPNFSKDGLSCRVCDIACFSSVEEQREHFKSARHLSFLNSGATSDGSLSSAESSSDDSGANTRHAAVKASANSGKIDLGFSCYLFSCSDGNTWAVYKAVLDRWNGASASEKLYALTNDTRPWLFIFLTAGHFFGAAVSPQTGEILCERSLKRYVSRGKQGGSQSKSDSSKGRPAHSAGAALRRANAAKLAFEVRSVLAEWSDIIKMCSVWWTYAPGQNKQILFSDDRVSGKTNPFSDASLRKEKIAALPFSIARVSRRAFSESLSKLIYMKKYIAPSSSESTLDLISEGTFTKLGSSISTSAGREFDINASVSANASRAGIEKQVESTSCEFGMEAPSPISGSISNKDVVSGAAENSDASKTKSSSERADSFNILLKLLKRKKTPSIIAFYKNNPNYSINDTYSEKYPVYCTLLHAASFFGLSKMVTALLGPPLYADASIKNLKGQTAYEVASEKSVRDAFRIFMGQNPVLCRDWAITARVPSPLFVEVVEKEAESIVERVASIEIKGKAANPVIFPSFTLEEKMAIERKKRLEAIERRLQFKN